MRHEDDARLFRLHGQLRPGRNRMAADDVERHQRDRAWGAALELVGERSFAATVVEDVVQRAGISRGTFYAQFENLEDCLLSAHDAVVRRLRARLTTAIADARSWREALDRAAELLMRAVHAQPMVARACLEEVVLLGPAGRERHRRAVRPVVAFLTAGAEELGGGGRGDLAAEIAYGGVVAVVLDRIHRGTTAELVTRHGEIAAWCELALAASARERHRTT